MTVSDGVSPSPKGGGAEPARPLSKSATENGTQSKGKAKQSCKRDEGRSLYTHQKCNTETKNGIIDIVDKTSTAYSG